MIGVGTKIRHRGGTPEINSSGRGAASAIGVFDYCQSVVFACRFFDFCGDVRNGMIGFEGTNWPQERSRPKKRAGVTKYAFLSIKVSGR